MADSTEKIRELGMRYKDYLIEKRRYFHQYPEVSWNEYGTSRAIAEELEKMGIPAKIVCKTGVVGEIRGAKPGKCVALRADIDALPVFEKTGFPFASRTEGVMHACGHDGHIAMLLCAARILCGIREELSGTVRLLFQPAEEGAGGSYRMIEEGVMKGVDSVFGFHAVPDLPAGKISVQEGPRMASCDFFDITLRGRSTHGATPMLGVDVVTAASSLVLNLQTIISREIDPKEPCVLTVGELHAGEKNNILASEAVLRGTTRTYSEEVRMFIRRRIEEMTEQTAKAFRAEGNCSWEEGNSAVINTKEASEAAARAAAKIMGEDALFDLPALMIADDVTEYIKISGGCYGFLGMRDESLPETQYTLHSPYYGINEEALLDGAMVEAQFAADMLA